MPRYYGRFFGIRVRGSYTKKLDSALQALNRNAARAWVKAVILRVPVWTGMALGSVKFAQGSNGVLSRYLNVSIPINPREHRKGKSPERGGTWAFYRFTASRHIYRFTFRSDLVYYIHNEFFARTDPGASGQQIIAPWHSLEAGEAAYRQAIRSGISKLPKVRDNLIKVDIPLGQ